MLNVVGRLGTGLTPEFINCCTTSSNSLQRLYAAVASGRQPSSTLRDGVGLDFVLGRHRDAAEQYAEAIREAVRERLTAALGKRRTRVLDLATLRQLPPSDLADACRLARLQSSTDSAAMAAALHLLLHPHAHTQSSPAGGGGGQGRQTSAASAAPEPVIVQRASWAGLSLEGTAAGTSAVADARIPSIGGAAAAAAAGAAGDVGVDGDEAAAEAAEAEAAEAAVRAAAEREADALFDEELQRRLAQASAPGSAAAAAGGNRGGGGNGGGLGREAPLAAATVAGVPSPAQSPQASMVGAAARLMAAAPTGPGESPTGPSAGPRSPLFSGQHPPHHQQQQSHQPQHPHLLLRTTELLVASERGAGGGSGRGPVDGTGQSGGVTYGGGGVGSSPYDPLASPPPVEVLRAVRRRLSRMGYGGKDPAQLRSLLLLSRRDLQELVRDFCGDSAATASQQGDLDPDLHLDLGVGTQGGPGLLSREQLAIRLLQLMGPEAQRQQQQQQQPQQAQVRSQPSELEQQQPQSPATRLQQQQRQPEPQSQQPLQQPLVTRAGGSGGAVDGAGGASVGVFGDPRRREVLEAAARRRELLAAAARPEEIASWLVKARAQDVLLIQTDPDLDFNLDVSSCTPPGAGSGSGSESGSSVVIATGLSQRHAFACAEAVRYQIRERIEDLAAEAVATSSSSSSSTAAAAASGGAAASRLPRNAIPGPPAVSGVNGGDWLSLEAGSVQVHVLTPQARQYYRLEQIFAPGPDAYGPGSGPGSEAPWRQGRGAGGRGRARVRLFGPAAGERQPETLETARVSE